MEYKMFMILAPAVATLLASSLPFLIRYWKDAVGRAIILYILMVIFLLLGNIFELASDSESLTFFWAKTEHIFWSFACVFWLSFCLIYSGIQTRVFSPVVSIVALIAFIFNLFIQTTEFHHLYYKSYNFFRINGYLTMKAEYGPLFWISGIFRYILLLTGAIFLIKSYIQTQKTYEKQSFWVVLAGLFPTLFNLMYIFRFFPWLRKDMTPLAFAVSGLIFFLGVYSKKLLYIIPIARSVVVQEMQAAIIVLDRSFRIIDYNMSASLLFSLNDNDLGTGFKQNKKILKLWDDLPVYPHTLTGDLLRREYQGRIFDIKLKSLKGKNNSDDLGVLITILDISDSVKLLTEKESLLDSLTKAQSELVKKEKLATVGLLSAGLAHEINNPLSFLKSNFTFIKQSLDKLRAEENPEKMRLLFNEMEEVISEAYEGFDRISGVVGNLLRFSRGNDQMKEELFNLNDIVQETLNLSRTLLGSDINISVDLAAVPLISGYPGEMGQLVLNLITNAVFAAREGPSPAILLIRSRMEEGGMILEVANSGLPIPQENKKLIFEPFFTTKKTGEGTGLGLSIVQDIVSKHKGRITLDDDGDLIRFILFFPEGKIS